MCLAYQAQCESNGHHLSKRQIASSVCSSNTCKYGTCEIISQISYKCHCQYAITGPNCDQQAPPNSPCASNPCYGSSTCKSIGATQYQCVCPAGYGGPQCKGTTGTCSCMNGGTCVATVSNGITAYECSCPSNFGGNLCQYIKSAFQSCQVVGCQNGGYCTIFSTCLCPTGFTGTFCGQSSVSTTLAPLTVTSIVTTLTSTSSPVTQTPYPLNVCAPGICLNNGACYQITNSLALCLCQNGYTGVYCNIAPTYYTTAAPVTVPVTPVTSSPAPVTTTATTTAAPATFCSSNPCKNGGLCVITTGTAGRCICAVAFTGVTCETGYTCTGFNCPTGQTCQIGSNFLPQCV